MVVGYCPAIDAEYAPRAGATSFTLCLRINFEHICGISGPRPSHDARVEVVRCRSSRIILAA